MPPFDKRHTLKSHLLPICSFTIDENNKYNTIQLQIAVIFTLDVHSLLHICRHIYISGSWGCIAKLGADACRDSNSIAATPHTAQRCNIPYSEISTHPSTFAVERNLYQLHCLKFLPFSPTDVCGHLVRYRPRMSGLWGYNIWFDD